MESVYQNVFVISSLMSHDESLKKVRLHETLLCFQEIMPERVHEIYLFQWSNVHTGLNIYILFDNSLLLSASQGQITLFASMKHFYFINHETDTCFKSVSFGKHIKMKNDIQFLFRHFVGALPGTTKVGQHVLFT